MISEEFIFLIKILMQLRLEIQNVRAHEQNN